MMNTEEVRCGYLVSKQMKELWSIQLELLSELLRVCNALRIKVFASGGTLLGGVRHKGYIPWDDDIDVILFRKDYEILLKNGPSLLKKEYFLQSTYSDKIMRVHAQLRKNGTTCFTKGDFGSKYHKGIFIDIFVYDKIPNDESERNAFKKALMERWSKINKPKFTYLGENKVFSSFIHNITFVLVKRIIWDIKNLFCLNRKKRFSKFEELCAKYNNTDSLFVSNVSFRGINPKTDLLPFKLEWFNNPSIIQFEDLLLFGPSNTDDYLKLQYGNYTDYVVGTSFHGNLFFDVSNDFSKYDKLTYRQFLSLFHH